LAKSTVICVEFLFDVARQKLLKSANARGAIQKKWHIFYGPQCTCCHTFYMKSICILCLCLT